MPIIEVARSAANPFDVANTRRDERGILVYDDLPANLVRDLLAVVERQPDAEAVVELTAAGRRVLTYRELTDAAASVAGGLRESGVRPGDRVAIRYAAGADWVVSFWGCLFARAIAVAINTRMAEPELIDVMGRVDVVYDLQPHSPLPAGAHVVDDSAAPDEVAAIFWTSGTTGRSKGVPTTHEAFMSNSETIRRCLALPEAGSADLRTLISVPLFHVTGCNAQLLSVLHQGGTAVVLPALDLGRMVSAISEEKVTYLVTVPAVYRLLLGSPAFQGVEPDALANVRYVGYGGAPITTELVRALQVAFPTAQVFNGFGTTESASIISVLPHADAVDHADSVGYAAPVVDLAIDIIDGTSELRGELLVRGPNVLRGYWDELQEADTAFLERWYRTGDIVTVDDAGRVRIVDRAKDIINRGGENVSSFEVEEALLSSPGVRDAAVIAVPDEVLGEKVGAIVVGDDIDVPAVVAHVAEQLADYKVPQYVVVTTDPLPRNPSGKLLKAELRRSTEWGNALR